MTCRTFRSLMHWSSSSPILMVGPVARRLQAHAGACPSCSAYRRSYTALPELLRRTHEQVLTVGSSPATWQPPYAAPMPRIQYRVWAGFALGATLAALLLVSGHSHHGISHSDGQSAQPAHQPASVVAQAPSRRADAAGTSGRLSPHAAHVPTSTGRRHGVQAPSPDAPERAIASRMPQRFSAPVPDDVYFNGRDSHLMAHWLAGNAADPQVLKWIRQPLPPMQDDFVHVPLPQLASADPNTRAAAEAVQQYEKEAKVVDSRLFKKVSFAAKAISLEEACASLAKQTGVRLDASRGIRDEKVTLFIKEKPARDVMRGIVRLFGLFWARSGEEGKYHYELVQDLRSQLAEQEMRQRDIHEALLSLDQQMTGYGPLLNLSLAEAKAREQTATGAEKTKLAQFVANWGAIQLYNHLSPADRAALADGQKIEYTPNAQNPDHRPPSEWRQSLLEAHNLRLGQSIPGGPTRVMVIGTGPRLIEVAGAQPIIGLHIDRSETGQLGLQCVWGAYVEGHDEYGRGGSGTYNPLAVGQNPSIAHPENQKTNAALRGQAPFNSQITLEPVHVCAAAKEDPAVQATRLGGSNIHVDENDQVGNGKEPPHAVAADVWEAVHRVSGLDVIADAYSRRFALSALTYKKTSLFDALCRAGDTLHARWRKDGDFLLCRSTSFYWDKLKEVPNRFLQHWQEDRAQAGVLPVDDVLDMAAMTDAQLDSAIVGRMIQRCWGLSEWGIVGNTGFKVGVSPTEVRPYARLLAELPPLMRRPAFRPEGMGIDQLPRPQQDELARLLLKRGYKPEILQGLRFHFDYVPSGWYVWQPFIPSQDRYEEVRTRPLVYGRTREETLAAARKFDPEAGMDEIQYSLGVLAFRWRAANGEHMELAGPGVAIGAKRE